MVKPERQILIGARVFVVCFIVNFQILQEDVIMLSYFIIMAIIGTCVFGIYYCLDKLLLG